MRLILALIKLVRWPNLVFIVLTQFLFWRIILPFAYADGVGPQMGQKLSATLFTSLTLASVLIAAGGYIINDYFDIAIDQVNKSSRVIIGRQLSARLAIFLYALCSLAGLLLSWYVSLRLNNYYVVFFNFLSVVFLGLYSTTFKKKLLIGNILVAGLTAWVILVLVVAEYRIDNPFTGLGWQRLLQFSLVYACFAWIISLVREVVKDMEDIEGDARFGCTTMPITWGIPATKVFAGVWLVILAGLVLSMLFYIIQLGWWMVSVYAFLTIILPVIWVLRKLFFYNTPDQYHYLSKVIKLIMLAGILSMVFFILI